MDAALAHAALAVTVQIATTIVAQLERRAPTASICPSEVARALAADEAEWRALMPAVRETAAAMRREGRLRITHRGMDVDDVDLHRQTLRLSRGERFGE